MRSELNASSCASNKKDQKLRPSRCAARRTLSISVQWKFPESLDDFYLILNAMVANDIYDSAHIIHKIKPLWERIPVSPSRNNAVLNDNDSHSSETQAKRICIYISDLNCTEGVKSFEHEYLYNKEFDLDVSY
jgi:hypothetical protein